MSKRRKEVDPIVRILGKNIRRMRKKARKTIKNVSDDTGMAQRDLIRLEAGFGDDIDPKFLLVFEKYFNVKFSDFFKGI